METINYNNYVSLIHFLAHRYKASLGVDQEELFSEGNLVFCDILNKYDRSRGEFSTLLVHSITNHFKRLKNKKRIPSLNCGDFSLMEINSDNTPQSSAEFWSELDSLSSEAREMVDIVLSSHSEINQIGNLHSHFREAGWAWETIWDSVKEIKSIFN